MANIDKNELIKSILEEDEILEDGSSQMNHTGATMNSHASSPRWSCIAASARKIRAIW